VGLYMYRCMYIDHFLIFKNQSRCFLILENGQYNMLSGLIAACILHSLLSWFEKHKVRGIFSPGFPIATF